MSATSSPRREFLRLTALAALPVLDAAGTPASPPALKPSIFVRLKKDPKAMGWKHLKVNTVATVLPRSDEAELIPTGKYGGNATVQLEATGKFRVQKLDRRWWFVDPEGHPFISCGLNGISPGGDGRQSAAAKAMGGAEVWAGATLRQLKTLGINTAGYWSRAEWKDFEQNPFPGMPHVYYGFATEIKYEIKDKKTKIKTRKSRCVWGLLAGFAALKGGKRPVSARTRILPVFHPDFEAFCDRKCQRLAALKDDPWLLGYFTDNELRPAALKDYLALNPADPIYGPAATEARRWAGANQRGEEISTETNVRWAAHIYDWYFKVTTSAIRKYDPEHLILGSRLFSWERNYPEIFAAAGRHLDVIAINPYGLSAVPPGRLKEWSAWAGDKPVLIGEFYVKGQDAGLGNHGGAGLLVANQEERGLYYQNYVLNLLRSGVCIGWHWHRYADQTPAGTMGSESGVNSGMFNFELEPYLGLQARVRELNTRVFELASRVGSMA